MTSFSNEPPATAPTSPASAPSAAGPACLPNLPGYEVLAELGRGGMGVVYKARHLGLGRLVALKTLRNARAAGSPGPVELARFRTEAEAAARLQHPNIVQVYEVGSAGDLPFLALEYCGGGSLAAELGGTPRPPAECAALVECLARAMAVAHQAGVIHRDLKPANILRADDGTLKISDFGLAKKLDVDEGQTHTGAILGTPSYMAPEQALGANRDVGPAADGYALGTLLYELLTGRPPFRAASVLETLEQVRRQEPLPPRHLQPGVPRDLETICLKCLQKDPGRRYADAAALADDLARFRAGLPIQARPVGPLERTAKWIRRYPVIAALLGLVVIVSVLGLAGILAAWTETAGERDRALESRRIALEAVDRTLTRLSDDDRFDYAGLQSVRRELLDTAMAYYQNFLQQWRDDPTIRAEIAAAHWRLARIYCDLGRYADAGEPLHESLRLYRLLMHEKPGSAELRAAYARSLALLGGHYHRVRRLDQALEVLAEADALLQEPLPKAEDEVERRFMLTYVDRFRAHVEQDRGDLAGARRSFEQTLERLQSLVTDFPATAIYTRHLAKTHLERGLLLRDLRAADAALDAFAQSVRLLEALPGRQREQLYVRESLGAAHNARSLVLWESNRRNESEQELTKALELRRRLVEENPENLSYRGELAASLGNLARIRRAQSRREDALVLQEQACTENERRVAGQSAIPQARLALISTYLKLLEDYRHIRPTSLTTELLERIVRYVPEDARGLAQTARDLASCLDVLAKQAPSAAEAWAAAVGDLLDRARGAGLTDPPRLDEAPEYAAFRRTSFGQKYLRNPP